MTQNLIKSVCVYCGSRMGKQDSFQQSAIDLGRALADADLRLVYGAGDVGLMGAVANAAQSAGGQTFGVIPVHLLDQEVGKRDLTHFIITENMHERKKVMVMNSDAFVLLPGGLGSLDEFFELLTWRQLGLHEKHCVILNIDGYWDPMVTMIDHQIENGFVAPHNRDFFTICESVPAAMRVLNQVLS
ncbi:Rossman fold protein, TIGR00730 family [Amylibacter kogurei]|uniref:Cytokinin riboside 5'-monophosphate phosphoribohydrolase n=1 Tax=Paramylibacter kogurei TaxID=1889778 RepID=A0A2G5K4A8_9RHOB|nr:TIGR00730 family Rossman fold protein [Amylibacter kogurei]PIB24361.1 Rossman fold protein, TIGR00730 family [Amylibacter kogurei]